MKKVFALASGLILSISLFAGSASAATPLAESIGDLMGSPYRYAGTTPKGFDCSGFTSYLFNGFDISLPHSSKSQNTVGYWIAKDQLREGDLVFFNTDGKGISHVGVYVGNGKFAHSATNEGVIITDLNSSYYAKRYVSARRILTDDKYDELMAQQ